MIPRPAFAGQHCLRCHGRPGVLPVGRSIWRGPSRVRVGSNPSSPDVVGCAPACECAAAETGGTSPRGAVRSRRPVVSPSTRAGASLPRQVHPSSSSVGRATLVARGWPYHHRADARGPDPSLPTGARHLPPRRFGVEGRRESPIDHRPRGHRTLASPGEGVTTTLRPSRAARTASSPPHTRSRSCARPRLAPSPARTAPGCVANRRIPRRSRSSVAGCACTVRMNSPPSVAARCRHANPAHGRSNSRA